MADTKALLNGTAQTPAPGLRKLQLNRETLRNLVTGEKPHDKGNVFTYTTCTMYTCDTRCE